MFHLLTFHFPIIYHKSGILNTKLCGSKIALYANFVIIFIISCNFLKVYELAKVKVKVVRVATSIDYR